MANIILTNTCNLQCPFCFASENNEVTDDNYNILNTWKTNTFLSGNTFRFCGGEPTLHPDITKMIDALLTSGKDIFIMTNGVWPESFSRYIKDLHPQFMGRLRYLFNILEPSLYKNGEFEIICSNLQIINPLHTTIGFTIYKENFAYDYLLELAEEFNIKRLRWSVAAPNISNNIDTLESKFYRISIRLYDFFKKATAKGISINGDCNYIQPCCYEEKHLNEILISSKSNFRFSCANSSPVDIGANGVAWRCYGLYSVLRKNISDFKNENELERYFTRRMRLLDNLLPYIECQECVYWQNGCNGGCYVYRIKKALKRNPDLKLFPIDDEEEILRCRPLPAANIAIKKHGENEVVFHGHKVIVNMDENTVSFLKEIDGKKTINDLINLWECNFSNRETACQTVIEKCRELFEKDIITIHYDYNIVPENRPIWN